MANFCVSSILMIYESTNCYFISILKTQGQFPRTVQANASTHEMQAQVAHTVQTNAPAYMPFSGGVREHQVGFGPDVNQGRFPSSVQTNTSTHVPFSGGVREQQVHFTPQPNQVRNLLFFSLLRVSCSRKLGESMS
jgi:replication factor A2